MPRTTDSNLLYELLAVRFHIHRGRYGLFQINKMLYKCYMNQFELIELYYRLLWTYGTRCKHSFVEFETNQFTIKTL